MLLLVLSELILLFVLLKILRFLFHFIPFFTPLYTKSKKLAFIHETAEEIWLRHRLFPINIIGYFIEPLFFKLYRNIPFMTVSNSTKRDLIATYGVDPVKIKIIHYFL